MNNILLHIEKMILGGESEKVEFKASFDREAVETLTAFANTDGGELLIGVQDSGTISGVTIGKESIQSSINQIKTATTPSIIPDVELAKIGGKVVVRFSLSAFPIKPVACRGKYFKRVHSANHLMTMHQVADAYLKTFQLSWDSYQCTDARLEDIDTHKVDLFIAKVNRIERFHLDEDYVHALEKFRFIKNMIPTNAAMFCLQPHPCHKTFILAGLLTRLRSLMTSRLQKRFLILSVMRCERLPNISTFHSVSREWNEKKCGNIRRSRFVKCLRMRLYIVTTKIPQTSRSKYLKIG